MKVLFIGPFDHTGYGHNSINATLALDEVGVDVVPRRVKFTETELKYPERLNELFAKSARGADVVIQNVLPGCFEYDGGYARNIGYYFVETSNFKSSGWANNINMMDEVWVACNHNRLASIESGVTVPVSVVPCAVDVSKYQKSYKPHKFREELGSNFIFYFIGEAIKRKNLPALVRAFHLEFESSEPVELLIKTSVKGLSPKEAQSALRAEFDKIKEDLGLYKNLNRYKRELVLTEFMSDDDMMRLHASCDCSISATFGEGYNLVALDALLMGKTPIVPVWGAHPDFIDNDSGWLIKGVKTPVSAMPDTHPNLYCGRQEWFEVDITALRHAMRECYENAGLRKQKALAGIRRASNFSYSAVGQLMLERLGQGG